MFFKEAVQFGHHEVSGPVERFWTHRDSTFMVILKPPGLHSISLFKVTIVSKITGTSLGWANESSLHENSHSHSRNLRIFENEGSI